MREKIGYFVMSFVINGILAMSIVFICVIMVAMLLPFAMLPVAMLFGHGVVQKILDFMGHGYVFRFMYGILFISMMLEDYDLSRFRLKSLFVGDREQP